MGCEAGQCKTSSPEGIFIVTPSLEGWPTKAKEATSPHEVRLVVLDTNPVFQSLGGEKLDMILMYFKNKIINWSYQYTFTYNIKVKIIAYD